MNFMMTGDSVCGAAFRDKERPGLHVEAWLSLSRCKGPDAQRIDQLPIVYFDALDLAIDNGAWSPSYRGRLSHVANCFRRVWPFGNASEPDRAARELAQWRVRVTRRRGLRDLREEPIRDNDPPARDALVGC